MTMVYDILGESKKVAPLPELLGIISLRLRYVYFHTILPSCCRHIYANFSSSILLFIKMELTVR